MPGGLNSMRAAGLQWLAARFRPTRRGKDEKWIEARDLAEIASFWHFGFRFNDLSPASGRFDCDLIATVSG
jgi:hypothetical protein